MMRWSRLHGDMQGVEAHKDSAPLDTSVLVTSKAQAKFLVG